MINIIEYFCNEEHLLLLPKFGTYLLTSPVFIPYLFAILLQQCDNTSWLISSFTGANR